MDYAQRAAAKSSKKRPASGGASAPAPSNTEVAELLFAEAARVEGASEDDLLFSLNGVDPDMFWFAEDGDDVDTQQSTRRQQEDALPALRPKHSDKEYEDFENGVAFVQGEGDAHAVDANDVKQGALGDCYLIAGMAAVARADPQAIEDLIVDNGDGTFDVTLYLRTSRYSRPRAVTRTVDARLAVKYSGRPLYAGLGDEADGQSEMWTALIEKALAQEKESYDLISGGNIAKNGFVFAGTTEMLTGKRENYHRTDSMDSDEAILYIDLALEEGLPVSCDSRNLKDDEELTREANGRNVYWNHAYAPISVDLDAETMDLQNPWGSSHVEDLSSQDFLRYYRSIRIGGGGL